MVRRGRRAERSVDERVPFPLPSATNTTNINISAIIHNNISLPIANSILNVIFVIFLILPNLPDKRRKRRRGGGRGGNEGEGQQWRQNGRRRMHACDGQVEASQHTGKRNENMVKIRSVKCSKASWCEKRTRASGASFVKLGQLNCSTYKWFMAEFGSKDRRVG